MKICLLGKYPPIEGGVSTQTFWLARGLASLGHQIHVVTNALDIEERYRIRLDDTDFTQLESRFSNGGAVTLHTPGRSSLPNRIPIPWARPFVSELASIAYDVVRGYACDLVYGYYFEPYVVSAWMAATWSGLPCAVRHAGSDLQSLHATKDLYNTYTQILKQTQAIITSRSVMERFLRLGLRAGQFYECPRYGLPTRHFNADAHPLDIRAHSIHATEQTYNPALPTIGIYGKIGIAKGSVELIKAMSLLWNKGRRFNFVAMVGTEQSDRLAKMLSPLHRSFTTFLPLLPNWKVPSFIRSCTAVCFLERDFPIPIHSPVPPREVIACGTWLILSTDIVPQLPQGIPDDRIIPIDSRNPNSIADALNFVISQPDAARHIGQPSGAHWEDHLAFLTGWERIFQTIIDGESAPNCGSTYKPDFSVPQHFLQALKSKLPALESLPSSGADSVLAYCRTALKAIGSSTSRPLLVLRDGLLLQAARTRARSQPVPDYPPPFIVRDAAAHQAITIQNARRMIPVLSNWLERVELQFDAAALLRRTLEQNELDPEFESITHRPHSILFLTSPNGSVTEVTANHAILWLLATINSARTVAMIARMWQEVSNIPENTREPQLLQALNKLHALGFIVFARGRINTDYRELSQNHFLSSDDLSMFI